MKNGLYEFVVAPEGYPGKRYRGKYVYEHQLVWWQNTGQVVPEGFLVHHKNEDKRDNRFGNLELLSRGAHTKEHNKPAEMGKVQCRSCGRSFDVSTRALRFRRRLNRNIFCSRSCIGATVGRSRPSPA